MTELMKQYEKDTGCSSTTIWRGEIVASGKYIEWLEAQLRWRHVNEKPEESCKCIGKFDDGELYDDLVYYDAKNDLWIRQVQDAFESWYTSYELPIKYFVIPPAPEGEVK